MKQNLFSLMLLTLVLFVSSKTAIYGLVEINDIPSTYNQNFDSFGVNNVNWADDSTLLGWFTLHDLGNVILLEEDNGTNSFPAKALNYGTKQNPDRALGTRPSNLTGSIYSGAGFINSSPAAITDVKLSYKGEQWRVTFNGTQQKLNFFYRIGGLNFVADNNVGWTAVPALDFTSPQTLTSSTNLDGNAAQNSALLTQSINGISVPPGETFWIRWFDADDAAQFDHGLAIDDVNVTFSGFGFQIDLKKPKNGKTLKFKSTQGFKLKGNILTTNVVTQVSYAAFTGVDVPTNLSFITALKLKELFKGKLFKQGVKYVFDSKKNRVGKGLTQGPINLVIKVEGAQGNNAGSWSETRIIANVKIK